MFLIQHHCPYASLAYLFGCAGQGLAVAVDVHAGEEDRFITMAEEKGCRITHVVDTHIHADHYSGGPKLAAMTGAEYAVSAQADIQHQHTQLHHGQCVEIGNVSFEVLETPGHTDDSICLLVTDHSRGDVPWFLLTGHTLFPGGVGRPDLHGREHEFAHKLYNSLFTHLLSLPDHVEILPGAEAGSVCGGGISGKPVSTLGFEKRLNTGLIRDRERFVAHVTATELEPVEQIQDFLKHNRGA